MDKKFLVTLLVFVAAVRFLTLGAYPLMDKTESRYAEIAREMVVTNNWITPQLDPGVPFWAKPPLSIWATALCLKVFGVNEFAARLSSFLFGLLTCVLTYILASHLRGPLFALMSVVILASTGLFYVMAGSVMTDPALTTSITLTLVSFFLALHCDDKKDKKKWGYGFFLGLGLCILAKGPVGWVLSGVPIFVWATFKKKWIKVFTDLPWVTGVLLTLMIAVPWHILAEMKTPGFLNYYIIGEHWERFTVSNWEGDLYGRGHGRPKGMIWIFAIPATLPWLAIFIPTLLGLKKRGRNLKEIFMRSDVIFLSFWFLGPLLFFTVSGNITLYYCLPGLPAFAILGAYGWYQSKKIFRNATLFVPVFCGVAAFTFLPTIGRQNSHLTIAQKFLEQRTSDDSRLFYLQSRKPSGDFYSGGKAVDLSDEYLPKMLKTLADDTEDFYVSREDYIKFMPRELFEQAEEIFRYDKYVLFKETK